MKAKEAPEKIYIQPNAHDGWFETNNLNESLIEYTRIDAFIEKACEWLKSKGGFTIGFPSAEIKDLKNYMKGE